MQSIDSILLGRLVSYSKLGGHGNHERHDMVGA